MPLNPDQRIKSQPRRASGRAGQRGLTLVEMLIALVLSSIIFGGAYQVISNLVQHQTRARIQNEVRVDSLLLDNLLSQVIELGIDQNDLFFRTQKSNLFRGRADTLQLVSRAYSDRFDRPGHRVYRLYQRDHELYVAYRTYDRDYQSNRQFELATGLEIEQLAFAYFEAGEWLDEWSDDQSIPQFIRVTASIRGLKPIELIRGTSRR